MIGNRKKIGLLLFLFLVWLLPHSSIGVEAEEVTGIEKLSGFDELITLLEEQMIHDGYRHVSEPEMIMKDAMEAAPAEESAGSQPAEHSVTNIQVEGVDEGDVVKTDGQYLYRAEANRIVILSVDPDSPMKQTGIIEVEENFRTSEIYLDENQLVVLGTGHPIRPKEDPVLYDSALDQEMSASDVLPQIDERMIYPPPYWNRPTTTSVLVYDVENPAEPRLERKVILEGRLLSSRKIDQELYFVTNRHFDSYWIMQDASEKAETLLKPVFSDSALENGALQQIDFDHIGYFPGAIESNYITVAGLRLDRPNQPVNTDVFLGRGDNLYASRENLYMAMEKWEDGASQTDLFRFALEEGTIAHKATGKVPGRVLNQFSMDEFDQSFRIATTTGQMWRTDEQTSKNHVYVLDMNLEQIGAIEDIAPTERIYSARFMGERAYLVTFREIDPFYVIDLAEPTAPEILGYLKIPGYSDYLHPYDENHILGFGKEVYDVKGNAIPGGFKIGVFDVSNVEEPIEKFKIEIGDTGTDSALLRNHKALLFSKEKDMIAFPITIMKKTADSMENPWQWGQFTFQGAHIYSLDLEEGFQLSASISHLNLIDYMKAGHYWYGSEKNIDRILYVGDTLITTSPYKVQRHHLGSFQLRDEVIIGE
ncbi:beta-propeller domain-containing protein [Tindallia californiensis]|uniref:Secreted protein containing C-terminal beta-propeller domain n=1 Tax=Tindallia californiensis TaxID=159292 RepID=A0A1H3QTB5_9FIRM|nr:beta-propeller domain-containing protein [Tindallia californiensis]SDZ16646.1 Secreted protein containing C-terminal beta-propeller domain [Tindallia californiensis]